MDIYTIALRLIHIFGGVFWVGSALLFFFFLEPAAKHTIPEGTRFVNQLMKQGRLALWIGVAAAITTLSGILLYFKDSNGFQLSWIRSAAGFQFTIGGVAGIIAFLLGGLIIAPTTNRLAILGEEIEKRGKPTPKQKEELIRLQKTMTKVGKADLLLLVVALALMIIAPEFVK
jgi:uncharacterized membrane protein